MTDAPTGSESTRLHLLAPVPRPGSLTLRRARGDAALCYYVYVPSGGLRTRAPLLVSVHGISRNAREHGRVFAVLAEQYGLVVLSPLFAKDFYPDFQRLGVDSGRHPDAALDTSIADVAALLGIDCSRFTLFGYSGGAQFAHRYALTHPDRVSALAVASAGWYTWPTDECQFPFGLLPNEARPDVVCRLDTFLEIPLCVLVGAHDTQCDKALRRSKSLDALQGDNRLARARAWYAELTRIAESRGIKRRSELRVLPASDHDFMRGVERDAIDRQAVEFLYGAVRHEAGPGSSLGVTT